MNGSFLALLPVSLAEAKKRSGVGACGCVVCGGGCCCLLSEGVLMIVETDYSGMWKDGW